MSQTDPPPAPRPQEPPEAQQPAKDAPKPQPPIFTDYASI